MQFFSPGANVSEREALPPPVAVSTVIFAVRDSQLRLPLVRRVREPFLGKWALPGGPVTGEESLTDVAIYTLAQTTGLPPRYLEQLYTFGEVDRAPAERIVSIVYWAQINADAANYYLDNVRWFSVDELPELAFDHARIIDYARSRLRNKTEFAHHFLGDAFTLADLRTVHQVILGKDLDPANFRRQILASGTVESTGQAASSGAHRPAALYRHRS